MSGEKDLNQLLASMSPRLSTRRYVFCHIATGCYGDFRNLAPIAMFMEPEGLTLVVEREMADENKLEYSDVFRCIALTVHSSLVAVGLTAAISTALSKKNISANVIAAYFHDHIFVPVDKADIAIQTLLELSELSAVNLSHSDIRKS